MLGAWQSLAFFFLRIRARQCLRWLQSLLRNSGRQCRHDCFGWSCELAPHTVPLAQTVNPTTFDVMIHVLPYSLWPPTPQDSVLSMCQGMTNEQQHGFLEYTTGGFSKEGGHFFVTFSIIWWPWICLGTKHKGFNEPRSTVCPPQAILLRHFPLESGLLEGLTLAPTAGMVPEVVAWHWWVLTCGEGKVLPSTFLPTALAFTILLYFTNGCTGKKHWH